MTVYFSHPVVKGLYVWSLTSGDIGSGMVNNTTFAPTLIGKIWLYLTKKHWHTDRVLTSDESGRVSLRGFKGDYIVSVNAAGKNRCFKLKLSDNVKAKVVLQ
jgi:hypothetical protein